MIGKRREGEGRSVRVFSTQRRIKNHKRKEVSFSLDQRAEHHMQYKKVKSFLHTTKRRGIDNMAEEQLNLPLQTEYRKIELLFSH